MGDEAESVAADDSPWPANYFNYFTEIEEHFQRARGTSLFLLSPLDWALIESWKNAGVPLEAALRGIDEAFDKWRSRKTKTRKVNSLAYCTQAVLEATKRMTGAGTSRTPKATDSPFAIEELRQYLMKAASKVRAHPATPFASVAESLDAMGADIEALSGDLEDLERRLTVLEEKLVAAARTALPDDDLLAIRRELDSELNPFRGKMTADQISMLERRYLDTAVLQRSDLPRLSLFYIHS
jgi:hypothetical protein